MTHDAMPIGWTLDARLTASIPPGVMRARADDRAEWLAMRHQDVTASAIAALLGEHPYQTAFGLYALKTGQIADAEAEASVTGTSISLPPMLRGTVLEPIAPKLITMLRPAWAVQPCGFYYREAAARIGATPDFVALDPTRDGFGIVQVKTTDQMMFRRVWQEEFGAVTPPMFIVLQAIVEAVLTGATWAEVAVLVSGPTLDLHLIPVPLHLGIMDRLRAEVRTFWQAVESATPPPADYGRDGEVLAALYRQDDGATVDLDGDNRIMALADEDAQLAAEMKDRKERRDAIKAEVLAKLGPAAVGLLAGKPFVTAKTQHRKEHQVAASSFRSVRFKKGAA